MATAANVSDAPSVHPPTVNAVQTLMSVNNIDQSVFKETDRATAVKYWDDCFFQNTVSEDIFDAIACKSGTDNAVRDSIKWTEIPLDFILDKQNLKARELQNRFQWIDKNFFNKDVDGTSNQDCGHQDPLKAFEQRLKNLRSFLQDLIITRLKHVFMVRAKTFGKDDYPHCKTLEDYLDEYRTGPYDNKKRALIFALCNNMWGRECFGTIEKQVMDKLKLKYIHKLIGGGGKADSPDEPKTRRSHGSIKIMVNRMRQTNISDRFRQVGQDYHKEVIYQRHLKHRRNGIIEVIKVTRNDHGFDGYLGLCNGHSDLLKVHRAQNWEPNSQCWQGTLEEFIMTKAREGSAMNPIELVEAWKKEKPTNVTVHEESSSCFSSITNSPTNSTNSRDTEDSQNPSPPPTTTPATSSISEGPTSGSKKSSEKKKSTPTEKNKAKVTKRKAVTPTGLTTPAKKKSRSLEELPANEKSPTRLQNGLFCRGCDHNDLHRFIAYERNYFTAEACAQENYPDSCSECKRSFLKGTDKTKHCTIGGIMTVKCCWNAINHLDHKCTYSLCHECHTKKCDADSQNNGRSRRPSRRVNNRH